MKRIVVLFVMFMVSTKAFARSTQIFKCKVSNPEWNAHFILDAVGAGFLKFNKIGDHTSYTCGLKLDYIDDGQRGIFPNITLEFTRESCEPELKALKRELLDGYTLIIDLTNKDKPRGRVQWLRRRQPDLFVVEKMSIIDVSTIAKRWMEGTWGRRTASEPKDLRKQK